MPRSGTTLAEQILSSHKNVYGAGELNFLREAIEQELTDENNNFNFSNSSLKRARDYYLKKISIFRNKSEYLIYPSLIESFGLPLIEANKFDCNIISSDLDYVHDIVKPSLVFDPNSIISISETVYLALNNDHIPKSKTLIKSKTNELLKLFYE